MALVVADLAQFMLLFRRI